MLEIVASYHYMLCEGKLMNQTQENGKNLVSGKILAHLAQIWSQKIFFHRFYLKQILKVVASYHCMQFQEKIINQT